MPRGKSDEWTNKEGLEIIRAWAREGLTKEDIAYNMGISRSTLAEWEKRFPAISDTLKRSCAQADARVVNELYRTATGYAYTEQQAVKCKTVSYDAAGRRCESEDVKVVEVTRYHAAETTAQIYWLNNRRRGIWANRVTTEQEGAQEIALTFTGAKDATDKKDKKAD